MCYSRRAKKSLTPHRGAIYSVLFRLATFLCFIEVIMSEETIPESRDYRHIKCGTITTISGQPFEVMSNPLSDMSRTWCSGCSSMFTLDEYEWADSGESIPAYYSRHSSKATSFQKFLCSRMNMLVMGGLGLLLGAIGGFLITRNGAIGAKIIVALVGGGIGGFAGLAIYVSVICNLVTKSVCGVADTRTLK